MAFHPTLAKVAADLAQGRVDSLELTRICLERIASPAGEGARSFVRTYRSSALTAAQVSDRDRAQGRPPAALCGIPLSIKDLFDVAGEPTTAGSKILANAPDAASDACIVQRLRAAGAILVGKTNMTEFAYSTLGLNPHYGTPCNPLDAARIPGGSSSGAAAAVAYGFSVASIGSDTAGSVRIPAAFCGVTGFKPTQNRISRRGVFPLSPSLDCIGPIAPSVACCATLDAVMAGEVSPAGAEPPLRALRFAIPNRYLIEGLDEGVGRAFETALKRLSTAGAQLIEKDFASFGILQEMDMLGGLSGPEAYALHRPLLARHGAGYDPRVRSRLEESAEIRAADYLTAKSLREAAMERFDRETQSFDAVLAPTVAITPPRFLELQSDSEYRRINGIVRRNCAAFNVLDRGALTVPCHEAGELPVGLMVVGERGADGRLLAIGLAIEAAVAPISAGTQEYKV